MADEEEPQYELVMPFVACKSVGGSFEDDAFTAGYHYGQIAEQLEKAGPAVFDMRYTVSTRLVSQLDLLAMRHGFVLETAPWDESPDEWTFVKFARQVEDDG